MEFLEDGKLPATLKARAEELVGLRKKISGLRDLMNEAKAGTSVAGQGLDQATIQALKLLVEL